MNTKLTLLSLSILLLFVGVHPASANSDWVIENNKVYMDTPEAYISVEPHTLSQPGYINLNVTSKSYAGNIDLVFLFNEAVGVKPVSGELLNNLGVYVSVVPLFEKHSFEHDGFDTAYLGRNLPVVAGREYSMRVWVDKPYAAYGKYGVALKPAVMSLSQARTAGYFYYLDPWFNSSGTDHEGADWTPADASSITGRHYNIGTFTITSGYTVTVDAGAELEVFADTINVVGTLSANGNGSSGSGDGGAGGDNSAGAGGGGGAGYGGAGAVGKTGDFGAAGSAGTTYGTSNTKIISMGSNGGNGGVNSGTYGSGGVGGGSITLVGTNLFVSGTVTANGGAGSAPGQGGGGGGGSGGGILLLGSHVVINGTVSANGGNGGNSGSDGDGAGGGGGGGRIKIVYSSTIDNGSITTSVTGGTGGTGTTGVADNGVAGTYETFTNSVPTTPTLVLPSNSSIERSDPIMLQASSTDADGDTLLYHFYVGTSVDTMVYVGDNEVAAANSMNWTAYTSNNFYWTVFAHDGYERSANMSTANFFTIVPPKATSNLLINPDVENWTGGTLDNWSYAGAPGVAPQEENTIVYNGTASAFIDAVTGNSFIYQAPVVESMRVYSGGAWVYSNDPVQITIQQSGPPYTGYWSPTHSGSGDWEFLEISGYARNWQQLSYITYTPINYAAYFDGCILVEGYDPSIVPYPSNGSTIDATYPPLTYAINFDWQDVGTDFYRLQIATDINFNQVYTDKIVSTDNSTETLNVDDTYFWRIFGYDGTYYSESSDIWYFTLSGNTSTDGTTGVHGIVTDTSGNPLLGAVVSISNYTYSSETITGSNGYYLFNNLENESTYTIVGSKNEYADATVQVTTVNGTWIIRNLVLSDSPYYVEKHYVSFVVQNIWGTRYKNVETSVYEGDSLTAAMTGITGSDGVVAFQLDEDIKYRVTFINDSQGISETRTLYPHDTLYYVIISSSLGSWDTYDTPIADAIDFDISQSIINSSAAYLNVSYLDASNGTTNLVVYLNTTNASDYLNQTNLDTWNAGATNNSSHSFIVSNYGGQGYFIHLLVTHDDYGTIDSVYSVGFDDDIALQFPNIPASVWLYGAVFMLIFSAGIFTVTTVPQGMLIITIENFVFYGLGCYNSLPDSVRTSILAGTILAFILSIIANLNESSKKEGYK